MREHVCTLLLSTHCFVIPPKKRRAPRTGATRSFAHGIMFPGQRLIDKRTASSDEKSWSHFRPAPFAQVLVSSEVRLQNFVAVEHLLINVLRQSSDTEHSALMVIRSAPQGAATITLLSEVIAESATSLLFSSRQRAALSTGELPPDSSADSKALEISLDPRLKRPLSSSQSPPPTQPALPVAVVRAGPRPVFPRPMQPAFPVAVVRAAPLPGFPPPFVAPSDGNFGPARGRGFHISSPPRGRSMGVQPHGRGGWGPGKGRPRRGRGRRGGCP